MQYSVLASCLCLKTYILIYLCLSFGSTIAKYIYHSMYLRVTAASYEYVPYLFCLWYFCGICGGETLSEILCTVQVSRMHNDKFSLEQVQRVAAEKIRGLESLSCEKGLKELGLGSLAKQRQREDMSACHKDFRGINTREGKGCSSYQTVLTQE